MKTIDEQYKVQFKEIKKRYRKKKLIGTLIIGMIAIGLIGYFYLSIKDIIEYDPFFQAFSLIAGIAAAVIAVAMPFKQTHSEYIELRDLNSAYTHERFRERNG